MKIKRVTDLMSDYVEVDEASRPKLTYDESKEAEAENNPLLEHFFVYLQVLLSQALESGFLETVYEKKDPTYMVPINEVEKLVKQKIDQMERALRWTPNVKVMVAKSFHVNSLFVILKVTFLTHRSQTLFCLRP